MKELSVYPVIYDQKVAWGDMDAFGHVNNVQYYRYIESSRILYMEKALLHKDLKCKAPLIEPNLRRNLGKW
ncbi:thioesterase family protein, partial [Acinetobacter baumannii]|uniref:acyl-CoA thioesterase n=3 Tax=Acinetobacter baumannii TaxID=470 RepID=UPI00148A9A43